MKILFVRVWRGNIKRSSMRILPSMAKAVAHAVKDCKAKAAAYGTLRQYNGNYTVAWGRNVQLEIDFIQAYELFENEEPRPIRDFKKRVEEALNGRR